jgi:general secretion pathway protein G
MKKVAFTLIELMLVVIIIGVLAAMVMPRLVGRSEQARVSAAKADINANIATALDLYEMDIGHYPDSLDELRKSNNDSAWKGPYIKKEPRDPWGRPYKYKRLSGQDKDYELCSGAQNEADTSDDICN